LDKSEVQRKGQQGSPRVTGSTSHSNISSNPLSESLHRLRPPPNLRKRTSIAAWGLLSRAANSANPLRMVFGDMWIAPLMSAPAVSSGLCRRPLPTHSFIHQRRQRTVLRFYLPGRWLTAHDLLTGKN
jgi:hypothetical protein